MRAFSGLAAAVSAFAGFAAPALALSYVFNDPRVGGAFIAACPTAQFCGNAMDRSADRFCQSQGHARSTGFRTDAVRARPGAYHMPTGTTCRDPNCIMFTSITCSGQAAANPPAPRPPQPAAQPVRVNRPMMNGRIVDWCWTWASNCGGPAANVVCRQLGYRGATYYATFLVPGGTYVMGARRYCQGAQCRGFNYVMCAR